MSICHNNNQDEDDNYNNVVIPKEPIKQINVQSSSINSTASHHSIMKRTKKNKTRIPKTVVFKDEEEILYPNKEREKIIVKFDQLTDEKIDRQHNNNDDKNKEKDINTNQILDNKEDQKDENKEKQIEIINTDLPINESKANNEEKGKISFETLANKLVDKKIESLKKELNEKEKIEENDNKDNNEEKNKNKEEENNNNKENENVVKEEHIEKEENDNKDKIEIIEENKDKPEEKNEEKEERKVEEEHIEKEDENINEKKDEEIKEEKKYIGVEDIIRAENNDDKEDKQ